jgi:hypothetical protein
MRAAGYFPLPEQSHPEQRHPEKGLPERTDDAAPTRAPGIPAGSAAAQPATRSAIVPDLATRLGGNGVRKTAPEAADPGSVAARLVGKRPRSLRIARSGTEIQLSHLNRRLPDSEVRQLAHAIEHGQNTVIDYRAASGGRTIREISGIQLIGTSLYAKCELRQDDRVFTVSRIQSVSPAR